MTGKIYKLVCGVSPEYYNSNENKINIEAIQKKISEIAEEIYKKNGVYFSGIIQPVKASYRSDLGCPIGGKDCFSYEYTYNPTYGEIFLIDIKFLEFADIIKRAFDQTTMTVTSHYVEVTNLS